MKLPLFSTLLLLLFTFLISCSDKKESNPVIPQNQSGYQYVIPEKIDDGWETASAEEEGVKLEPLIQMVNMLDTNQNHQIHNILIFKNNKLVFEKYFTARSYTSSPPGNGGSMVTYSREMLHYLASGSKSVTSVLFGIAIKEGFIDPDLNKKIIDYFPHYNSILEGEKSEITVQHLLTMTSGLDFDENTHPYGDSRNDVTALFYSTDPIRYVLNKPMHAPPGQTYHYNSGVTNVIGEIIRLESELNLLEFAELYLFEPLGINEYHWEKFKKEYYFASGGLSLIPRDMAKIGQLFLNNGSWNGKQILSNDWIEESIKSYAVPNINITSGYGYQWWVENTSINGTQLNIFMSAGYGEQYMIVIPEIDIIIIFNGGYFSLPITVSPFQLLDEYIVYALFPDF